MPVYTAVAPDEVLAALPPTASQALRHAIAAGCCVTYTVAEGHCTPACGSGACCFHVVSTDCGINSYECVNRSCDKGNFTTGC